MIQRYDFSEWPEDGASMDPEPEGKWVRYDDIKHLLVRPEEQRKATEMMVKAARAFRDGFTYDPGHSDLDNEQPIHVRVTLGDWRLLNFALGACDAASNEPGAK